MTKHYCDICGNAAAGSALPTFSADQDEKKWSGTKCANGSVCDGTWIPRFTVTVSFSVENLSEEQWRAKEPDLCDSCKIKLIDDSLLKTLRR